MPRPPRQPRRAEVAPDELELFDKALNRFIVGYMRDVTLADDPVAIVPALAAELNSPPFAAAIGRMGTASRMAGERPGGMSHADREWVDQVLSYHFGYYFMLGTHTPDALALGVRLEALQALSAGNLDLLTARERLLTDYIMEVVERRVSDATYASIESEMGERGAVEFTIFTCYFQFLLHLFMAFGGTDMTKADIDRLLEEVKEGTRELPDWRIHIR